MKPLALYAVGRLVFGIAALAAPAPSGRLLAGDDAAEPEAQAFLRGMGGREIGLGLGILGALRAGRSVRPWLVAGVVADASDLIGIAGAWRTMPPDKRVLGVSTAGAAAAMGAALLAMS
ncbi:MAG TPA: hypothetical protein VH496_21785 [Mycobacterium sp.]|jgi:hypothetical protein